MRTEAGMRARGAGSGARQLAVLILTTVRNAEVSASHIVHVTQPPLARSSPPTAQSPRGAAAREVATTACVNE